jgi:hypothetical protein
LIDVSLTRQPGLRDVHESCGYCYESFPWRAGFKFTPNALATEGACAIAEQIERLRRPNLWRGGQC